MTHQPHYGHDPHGQPPYQGGGPYQGGPYQQGGGPYQGGPYQGGPYPPQHGRDRRDGARTAANIIHLVTGLIVSIFVLHILFVVFDANQGNDFVEVIYGVAQVLVLGLGDVFTPDDATIGVVVNYGLAALIYLVLGQFIVRTLRRS
jgi:hypothetical protein